MKLPEDVMIFPAHTNKPVSFDQTIVAASLEEVKDRVHLLQVSEEEFIIKLSENLPPTPPNYLTIVEKNLTGDFTEAESIDLEAGANRCAVS